MKFPPKREYQCRDCGKIRKATSNEIEFGRVICYACGGTCDPTEETIESLDKAKMTIERGRWKR